MDIENNNHLRWPPFRSFVIVAVLSALLGGIAALYAAPILQGQGGLPGPRWGEVGNRGGNDPFAPLAEWQPGESPVIGIAERVGPSVVSLTNLAGGEPFGRRRESTGSGVIIDSENGYIVTNYHVVEGARTIKVTVDERRTFDGKLVGGDLETDLAVVQVEARDLPAAPWGDSARLRVGEMAVAIGNPLGEKFFRSVTVGVISALNRDIVVEGRPGEQVNLRVLQTDAAINPGNSGGPLVNIRGEVIGINSAKIHRADVEGMGFAIPSNDARPIIEQLVKHGFVRRPFIGIFNFEEITPQESEWYKLPEGIYVGGILTGGPAARAGMRAGDVIVEIGGDEIRSYHDLQSALAKSEVGDRVIIEVVRNGRRVPLNVTLGEKPRK
ncbi:MAG: S1C family serine protease [Bacillota bacterium]